MKLNTDASPTGQTVSLVCIVLAAALAVLTFVMSRYDQGMKMLALGAVISLSSALMATASTLLTGKVFDRKESVTDVPAGSSVVQTNSTEIKPPAEQASAT